MRPLVILLLLGFLALPHLSRAEEPLPTFILAGQSNMVGKRCLKEELPEALQSPNPNALFFDAKALAWIPIEPGKTEREGFGPEIAFGAAMAEHMGRPIGIIKHSVGGTNLHVQWDPEDPKSLYGRLKREVEAAAEARPIQIVGMLWVQGGADAKSQEMAQAYAANLEQFIHRAREDFGNPEMPFVAGRMPKPNDTVKKPHWQLVRSAQQDLKMEHYVWVDCDTITVGPDKVHYDTAGMVTLGNRAAVEIMTKLFPESGQQD